MDKTQAPSDTSARKHGKARKGRGYRGKYRGARGRADGSLNWRSDTPDSTKRGEGSTQAEKSASQTQDTKSSKPGHAQPAPKAKPAQPTQPAQQASKKPASKKNTKPVAEKNIQPVPEKSIKPVSEKSMKPVSEKNTKTVSEKDILALEQQHDELSDTLEERKKHLESLTEEIATASAKLECLKDTAHAQQTKEDELAKKEKDLARQKRALTEEKAMVELKITQYKRLLGTLAPMIDSDIMACIDNIIEFYYDSLQFQVRKSDRMFARLIVLGKENMQLQERLQVSENKTTQ